MEREAGGERRRPSPSRTTGLWRPGKTRSCPALAGFFRTLRELLFRPGEFFKNLGREGWAGPLAFALIVSSVGLLGALFWQLLVLAPAGGTRGTPPGSCLSGA